MVNESPKTSDAAKDSGKRKHNRDSQDSVADEDLKCEKKKKTNQRVEERKDAQSPKEVPPAFVNDIEDFLQSKGGHASMSQVCGKFHMPAAEIRRHFHVEGSKVVQNKPLTEDQKSLKAPADEQVPAAVVLEVGNFLNSKGGQAPLSQICGRFHLKAAVIRLHFHIEGNNVMNQKPSEHSDERSLRGPADEHVPASVVADILNFLDSSGGQAPLSTICGKFHLKIARVRQHFHVEGLHVFANAQVAENSDGQSHKEPADEELDPEVIFEIIDFLESNGGQAKMSRICGKFRTKPWKIEKYFHVEDDIVTPSAPDAATNFVPESEVKESNGQNAVGSPVVVENGLESEPSDQDEKGIMSSSSDSDDSYSPKDEKGPDPSDSED